jgi:hypothetical protein
VVVTLLVHFGEGKRGSGQLQRLVLIAKMTRCIAISTTLFSANKEAKAWAVLNPPKCKARVTDLSLPAPLLHPWTHPDIRR